MYKEFSSIEMEMDLPVVSSQQMSLPSSSSHEANNLYDITYIKSDPDDMEYIINKTSQGASHQQIPLPSPLKCEVKEEIMYCQFCPYSDVEFGRLKFHTFIQHPTGAAVVKLGESDNDIKFFCVKETCNFSTTMCTVYEEHLMNCCPLNQTLSEEEKERLKSTLQFVLDFHTNHGFVDVTRLFLEYSSSINKIDTSEDDHIDLRKLIAHNDSFSVVSKSSSLSDIQSSMICEDVGGRMLEAPSSSVLNPVPVFIVQNQNTTLIESQRNISENNSVPVIKENTNNEWLLKTDPAVIKMSKSQVHTHMKTQNGQKPFACLNCEKCFQYRSALLRHLRIHTDEKPFKCEMCDKAFFHSQELIAHKRKHTGEKPFKCNVCDKCFADSSTVIQHRRTHTGEKPYKCNVCDKEYTRSSILIVHKRTHTGEKPYKCNVCDKGFFDSSSLYRHKRTHTGEKPFKCDVCDRGFAESYNLITHIRTHTGDKPFKCNICDREFTFSSNLIVHKRTHTGEKPFKCNVCDKEYTSSSHLIFHKKNVHR